MITGGDPGVNIQTHLKYVIQVASKISNRIRLRVSRYGRPSYRIQPYLQVDNDYSHFKWENHRDNIINIIEDLNNDKENKDKEKFVGIYDIDDVHLYDSDSIIIHFSNQNLYRADYLEVIVIFTVSYSLFS